MTTTEVVPCVLLSRDRDSAAPGDNVPAVAEHDAERLSDAELARLDQLLADASPAPWVASIEGRDHTSGEDVILIGDPREEDMYVSRDSAPASAADLDLIAAARNSLPALIAEVRRARPGRAKALRDSGKRPYLAIDDYGTGGIWIYLWAESADQITARYPGLTVITEWREWMTPDRLIEIIATIGPHMTFDIDQPDGWLARADEALRRPSDS